MKSTSIKAGEFKAKCLSLMDEVHDKHITITITKHGEPIAMLVPVEKVTKDFYGCLKGTTTVKGDITSPLDTHWEINE